MMRWREVWISRHAELCKEQEYRLGSGRPKWIQASLPWHRKVLGLWYVTRDGPGAGSE